MVRGDYLQCHGWSRGTKYSAMDGLGGLLLGETTYSMTGEVSIDPALLPTGALEVTEQDERSDSRHRVWSVHLSQAGAEQGD